MWFFCTTGHAMSGPAPLFDFLSPGQNIFREEVFHLEAFWSAPPSEPPSAPRRTTWVGWTSWTRTCRGSPPPQSGSPRQISQSQFGRARPCLGIWPHDIYCQVFNCHCLKSQVSGLFWLFLSLPSIAKYIVRQNDAIYATQRLKICEELRITFSEAWPRVAWGRGCRRGGCTWSQEISSGSFLLKNSIRCLSHALMPVSSQAKNAPIFVAQKGKPRYFLLTSWPGRAFCWLAPWLGSTWASRRRRNEGS